MAKYPGVTITVAGEELVVPGISLRQVREYHESGRLDRVLAVWDAADVPARRAEALTIIHETIRRNHPTLAVDFLEAALAERDLAELLKIILTTSGFERKEKEGPADPPRSP